MSDQTQVRPRPSHMAGAVQKLLTEIQVHLAGVPQIKADIAGCKNHLIECMQLLDILDGLQGTYEPVEQDSEENHTRQ